MRLVLDGTKQNLYTLIITADSRWPHVNAESLQIQFPPQTFEAGNAGASVKIGDSTINGSDNTGIDDILTEGDRKFYPPGGDRLNGTSLRNKYALGSAASTVIWVEPVIG